MLNTLVAISVGASLGAVLRWVLGTQLNGLFPDVPPGTLAANLVGGYIVGIAIAYFGSAPDISPEWRLFIITGFCGGLTTFSTFSGEIVSLMQQGRLAMAGGAIAAHVIGSVVMTILGIGSFAWIAGTR